MRTSYHTTPTNPCDTPMDFWVTYQQEGFLNQFSRFPITDGKWLFIGSFWGLIDTLAFSSIGVFTEQGDAETGTTRRSYVSESIQVRKVLIIQIYITDIETFVVEMSQYHCSVFV